MREYWIVYDKQTGAECWRGGGAIGQAEREVVPEGMGLIAVPEEAVKSSPANLGPVRAMQFDKIDAAAEATRQRFITAGSGQAMTYLRKEDEARAWLVDANAETPFLSAEAAAIGSTVAALAAQVIANADAWKVVGPRIEAARLGAKKAVRDADNVAAIDAASQVDWTAVVTVEG